jgi:hypothetical protein
MDHSWPLLLAEILAATIFLLWLGRRIVLTTIYVCVLIKFSFRALRRFYRRQRVVWRAAKTNNPHGFVLRWLEWPFRLVPPILLRGVGRVLWWPAIIYGRIENWAITVAGPWCYQKMPSRLQRFTDWLLTRVQLFMERAKTRRRAAYASASLRRYHARLAQKTAHGQCPMRQLLPPATRRAKFTGV